MEIKKSAVAGTMESSDIYVQIEPAKGISINLDSVVINQFGAEIDRVVREVLTENGIKNALLTIKDRGAVECVIRARVETAIKRGGQEI